MSREWSALARVCSAHVLRAAPYISHRSMSLYTVWNAIGYVGMFSLDRQIASIAGEVAAVPGHFFFLPPWCGQFGPIWVGPFPLTMGRAVEPSARGS